MVVVTATIALTGRDTAGVSAGQSDVSDGAAHASRTAKASVHDPLAALPGLLVVDLPWAVL